MSDGTSTRVTFNKKLKFEVGKPKLSKPKGRDNGGSERGGTFTRRSRDDIEGNRGYGGESSDLKRKRVYADRGNGGERGEGGAPERKSFSKKGPRGGEKDEGVKRRIREKKDISEYDRLNRVKFSSNKGGNAQKDESGERRGRKKKEVGSWKDYKGKGERLGGNRSFDREERGGNRKFDREERGGSGGGAERLDSKIRARERFVSSKQNGDEKSDSKFKSGVKVRERWPNKEELLKRKDRGASTKQGDAEESDSKFSQGKTRDRWPSTNRDGDGKSTTKDKSRDRSSLDDDSEKQNSKNKSDKQVDRKPSGWHKETLLEKTMKKMIRSNKSSEEDSLTDGPPKKKKKKKKRLGIHPYDASTKRMDDGISFDGKAIEKKVDSDKDIEISKNAQFRAIQPSLSILSFVEDNLLGRRREIDFRRAGYNIDLSAPLDNIPNSTSIERERIEEAVFRNKLEFTAAAKVSSSFPTAELPEIAFAGRSNVGKSSLLNALTRQWGVVRTSDKPGLTQTINFFKLGSKLCMVDLPGYGFAYAKEEVKDAWEELVKEYVSTRVGLKRVCLLIDTKWGMKPRDQELINLMERSQTKYQIVLTKTDTVFPMDVARRATQIEEALKANKSVVQPLMMVSSTTGGGIRSLRRVLAQFTRFAKL